jgi:hypothetical protein
MNDLPGKPNLPHGALKCWDPIAMDEPCKAIVDFRERL